ncbi:MAG: AAA family ATPase [Candidatus Binatia bacterium]
MSVQRRYLLSQVRRDLARKMVFVAGPRQVGKTTLVLSLSGASAGYLSWDVAEHRERILKRELPDSRLWIFDEVHKYRSWRNLLKGLYDGRRPGQRILVTGSARLDFYRFGGDSLQGDITCCGCIRSRQRNWPFARPPGWPICSNWEGFPNLS